MRRQVKRGTVGERGARIGSRFWTNSDQLAIAAVLGCGIVAVGIGQVWRYLSGTELVNVETVLSGSHRFETDINAAPWQELALIPGLGETLARRIVEERQRRNGFDSVEELMDVEGIGPKKLAAARRYVRIGAKVK